LAALVRTGLVRAGVFWWRMNSLHPGPAIQIVTEMRYPRVSLLHAARASFQPRPLTDCTCGDYCPIRWRVTTLDQDPHSNRESRDPLWCAQIPVLIDMCHQYCRLYVQCGHLHPYDYLKDTVALLGATGGQTGGGVGWLVGVHVQTSGESLRSSTNLSMHKRSERGPGPCPHTP
jgi:hypothetical protein